MKKERNKVLPCFAALFVLLLALGALLYLGPTLAYAGDHLSASNNGCTKCHGTNIRQIHDYEDTIPLDCNICHSTGGTTWYLNDDCKDNLIENSDLDEYLEQVGLGWWDLVLDPDVEFGFNCDSCHSGMKTEPSDPGSKGNK